MASSVEPSRFIDGAIMTTFLMCLSATILYMFGQLWSLMQQPPYDKWGIGTAMKALFPCFYKSFDYNLTHVLLFSVCVLLMSIRPEAPKPSNPQRREIE